MTAIAGFSEDALLPISALQHLLFCERQCALIHIEGLWSENRLTVEGRHLHQKAHDGAGELRSGVRIARGLALCSFRLSLVGDGGGGVHKFIIEDEDGITLEKSLVERRPVSLTTLLRGSVQLWARKIDTLALEQLPGQREVYAWHDVYERDFLGHMAGVLRNEQFLRAGGAVI